MAGGDHAAAAFFHAPADVFHASAAFFHAPADLFHASAAFFHAPADVFHASAAFFHAPADVFRASVPVGPGPVDGPPRGTEFCGLGGVGPRFRVVRHVCVVADSTLARGVDDLSRTYAARGVFVARILADAEQASVDTRHGWATPAEER